MSIANDRTGSYNTSIPTKTTDNENIELKVIPIEKKEEKKDIDDSNYITLSQFAIALVKNTTGPGVLAIPYAIGNMGLIPSIIMFAVVAVMNVWCSFLLIEVMEYTKKNPSKYLAKKYGNDYSSIMYHVFGPFGVVLFNILYLISLWGILISVLISVVDFIKHLPWPEDLFGNATNRALILHILSTVVVLFFVLLNSLKPLVFASTFSIIALLLSFIILLIYGFITYGIKIDNSILFAPSFSLFLSSIGVPSFSLGYNFSFLSFYKAIYPPLKPKAKAVNIYSITGVTLFLVIFPMLAFLSYRLSPTGMAENVLISIPSNNIFSILINIMMFISCLFTYPIITPPLNEVVEEHVKSKRNWKCFIADPYRLSLRIAQTVGVSAIAYLIPYFSKVISLVGGFVITAISLVIPPLIHYVCYRHTMSVWSMFLHFFVGLFSIVFMCISTFYSAKALFVY